MFIIIEYQGNYEDIWIAMKDVQFEVITFKTRAEAEGYAKANCPFGWKVVEI